MSNPSARILSLRKNPMTAEELDISRVEAILSNFESTAEYYPIKYFLTELYNLFSACEEDFHNNNIQAKLHELITYLDEVYLE